MDNPPKRIFAVVGYVRHEDGYIAGEFSNEDNLYPGKSVEYVRADSPETHAVEVRPLSWNDYDTNSNASCVIGCFRIDIWDGFANVFIGKKDVKIGVEGSDIRQAAKDVAQTYFDMKINSALNILPGQCGEPNE